MNSVVHRRWLVALVLCLALTLLGIVDIRRGFLFATYGVRTAFFAVHPWHALMLAAGLMGMFASYRRLQTLERESPTLPRPTAVLAGAIAVLLVLDLATYRLVPAARSMAAGRVGIDWLDAFGTTGAWKSIALATSYLGTVWHATMLGILLAGLAQTMFPMSFVRHVSRGGFQGSMFGALAALPQPFCSCCASAIVPPLARRGATLPFLLAFVVGSPMLNVTTLVLAGTLLPPAFALTRIVGGVVVTLLVTYLVARVAGSAQRVATTPSPGSSVDRVVGTGLWGTGDPGPSSGQRADTPGRLFRAWLLASCRIGLVLVPMLWASSVVASGLFLAVPSVVANTVTGVVLASIVGTFFMISTWSEIGMVLPLLQAGLPGPAAALLVVLPAVSLPGMVILGGAIRRTGVVALLVVAVMLSGIAAGLLFV